MMGKGRRRMQRARMVRVSGGIGVALVTILLVSGCGGESRGRRRDRAQLRVTWVRLDRSLPSPPRSSLGGRTPNWRVGCR